MSNFFRNPLVYELLGSRLLPDLLAENRDLRIWSLGCAEGEEPYSLAMMLAELLKKERSFHVEILGTDLDAEAIRRGVKGEYPEGELEEVKKKYLDTFFRRIPSTGKLISDQRHLYRVQDEIKSMVKLECGDIIRELKQRAASGRTFHVVLCRNVLIYMNRALQEKICGYISDIIRQGGYFIIGESETIPDTVRNAFIQLFPGVKIYKKNPKPGPVLFRH